MEPLIRRRTLVSVLYVLVLTFSIPLYSVAQAPANDACSNAIPLTPAAGLCNTTAGALRIATGSATSTALISAFCGNAASPDVWYSFVATHANPTITLSNMGTQMDNAPRLQIFNTSSCLVTTLNSNSLSCASGTNVVAPATLSITNLTLTVGNTYLIRVFTNGNSVAAGVAADWNFNICISDPPANDLCGGAITLTSAATCVATNGTLTGANYLAGGGVPGACAAANLDVWYSFVAQTTNPTITTTFVSGLGQRRSELYSGTCGALTSMACSGAADNLAASGLTIGQTYYVRVYSNNTSPYNFTICVVDPPINDICSTPVTVPMGATCNMINSTFVNSTYTAITGACGTSRPDVWYLFTPNTSSVAITTTGNANIRLQVYTAASCGGTVTSVSCINAVSGTVTGLTPGNQYLVRAYYNSGAASAFDICIADAAPNDLCANFVTLTSSTSCVNTAGNMYGATLTAPTINAPDCSGGLATYDVWYRFVAQTTNPTITLSNIGASFSGAARMQLLSNNCGGTFTSYFCGTTSIAANFLTPGTIYFVRVYGTGALPTTLTGFTFDICITDPVSPAPPNDNCAGAATVSVNTGCSSIPGDMAGATPSAPPLNGSCVGSLVYDVWYKFTAVNNTATVDLGGYGSNNFLNPGIEVFTGNCGALTSIACGAEPLTLSGVLTAGTTYYVRVYSQTAPPPNGNARFTICVTSSLLPVVRSGNSYVNITKKTTGGVVEPGDTLEIRMTINHTSGTMYRLRYVDNVPTNTTMVTGTGNFMGVITNEGLAYHQYTLGGGDDAGTYVASPGAGEYNIRLNLAFGTSSPGVPVDNTATEAATVAGSTMINTDRPRGGGGLLFATAFRVVASGAVGDTITLNAGNFIYRTSLNGSDITLTSTPYKILITDPLDLCANSIGLNNATESGGTFGTGTTLNRATDLSMPIAGYSFVNNVSTFNHLGDGRYAIVKNISPRSSTNRNANRVPSSSCGVLAFDDPYNCNNRMHNGHWYIDGDHSGTSDATGNLPPNAVTNSGYMLMVNADYVASEVFSQSLTNLCPNTYYEFSAWIRNICPTCGVDSTGAQFAGTPTSPALGYPGVYPNLSFALNGVDYYSTGEVDTTGWQKRGFVFRTGPTQTSAVFSIRNNAQGGGGNDWVMDDIAVATCLPTMSYSPTINPTVCYSNPITINDTISSYFKNYTTYKWQRSQDGGATWTDITSVVTLPDTNYYITTYVIPATNTTLADDDDRYRVVVATTADNLVDPNCNISDGVTISLSVIDCGIPLSVNLLSFNGNLMNGYAVLSWSTAREDEPVRFELERSYDGINFTRITTVNGKNNGQATNYYSFTDPELVIGKNWYRVAMIGEKGSKKYSHTIQLSTTPVDFALENIVNPFNTKVQFNVVTAKSSKINVELMDIQGKIVKSNSYLVHTGTNSLTLENTQHLADGVYTLRVENKGVIVNKRLLKRN